jgi:hypothetical protein
MDTTSSNSATYCKYKEEFTIQLIGVPLSFSFSLGILLAVSAALLIGTLITFYSLERAAEMKLEKEYAMEETNNFEFSENIFP